LVQIILWFNLAALFPRLSLGIPFGPTFVSGSANVFITSFVAANLGLGLNEAAYMAEIVRAGIVGIDRGQSEAASALGLTRRQTMWSVVLPQALRIIIPPAGNEVIGMLKYTSLASVVAVTELLEAVELIYQRNFQTIPLLLVASLWYLIVTILFTMGQRVLENYIGRSLRRESHLGFFRGLARNLVATRGTVSSAH
jgi:polar amino acid transport system permease protein